MLTIFIFHYFDGSYYVVMSFRYLCQKYDVHIELILSHNRHFKHKEKIKIQSF